MRADRLLSILLLLQAHQRMTARDLAQRLEVSERTILRDMSALGSAGIPVRAERGVGGGWMLLDSYRTTLTGLKEVEIQALFLTRPQRLLADLGLDKAAEVGLLKLLAALPSASRRGAQDISQRIHVDVGGWRRAEEATPQLPILQEAVWQERRLRMVYQRGDESVVERVVDPLGLVAKGSVWYLVAGVEGEPRSYRVSRVQQASQLEEPCRRKSSRRRCHAIWQPCASRQVYWGGCARASAIPSSKRRSRQTPKDGRGWRCASRRNITRSSSSWASVIALRSLRRTIYAHRSSSRQMRFWRSMRSPARHPAEALLEMGRHERDFRRLAAV
jgi:predicted DNA-binding transcriptional regulator YafY